MQISKIVRGCDFSLQINVVQPQYLDGRTEWEDYNVSQCTDIKVNLICTKDQIVIPLEWKIKEGTDNVIIAKVLGKWLHIGVYSLEITGIDPDGRAWRYKNKSVFSIVDATANSEITGDLIDDTLLINAETGLFIPNAGPQGHQGEIGPQGFQGTQGFQGEIGHQGPQGHQGEIGLQGFQGTQGFQGEIGHQGPQGTQGEIGQQGPQGEVGPIGPQGPKGIVNDDDKFSSYEERRNGIWIIYKKTENEPIQGYSLYELSKEDRWSQRYIATNDTSDLILSIMSPGYHSFNMYSISSTDASDILYDNLYPIKIYEQDSYGVFGRNENGYLTYDNKIIYMDIIPNVEFNYDKINGLIIPTEAPIYNIQLTDSLNPIRFNAYHQETFAYQTRTYTKNETDNKIYDLESRLQNEINNIELTPGPQGPQGDKGDTGETGQQGPQGDKGDTGEAGPQGEVGPIGPQGPEGIVDDYDKFGSYEERRNGIWIIYKNTETEPMPGYSLYKLSKEDSWSQRYKAISDTDDLTLDIMSPDYHRFSLYPISSTDASDILYYNMYPIKIYEQDSYGVFGRNEKGYLTYDNKIIYMIIIKNVEGNYDKINSLIIPTEAPIDNIKITDSLNPIIFNAYQQYTFAYQKNTYNKDETDDKIRGLESRLQNEINNIELVSGPQGPQGEIGHMGYTGLQGDKGPQGPQGDKGDTGETGLQGDKGDKGYKGDTGQQGPQGDKGYKGNKGDTGETGPQGPQGDKGYKGDTGQQGPQGDKGYKGDTGQQGPQGDKGDKGNKGDTGETGPQGPQGSFDTSNLSPVAFTGSYNDLSDKPTIPTVPTNVSAFNNDAGYLTAIPNTVVTSTTTGLKIEVVSAMPQSPNINTLYIVQ